jgi:hypothetical protein
VVEHPWVGGRDLIEASQRVGGIAPHNVVLNAGAFYGALAMLIVCRFLWQVLIIAGQTARTEIPLSRVWLLEPVLILVCFTFNSFFHNQSILSGDAVVLVSLVAMRCTRSHAEEEWNGQQWAPASSNLAELSRSGASGHVDR